VHLQRSTLRPPKRDKHFSKKEKKIVKLRKGVSFHLKKHGAPALDAKKRKGEV